MIQRFRAWQCRRYGHQVTALVELNMFMDAIGRDAGWSDKDTPCPRCGAPLRASLEALRQASDQRSDS